MKFALVLLVSMVANSVFAGTCQVGSTDRLRGSATGIVGGSQLVQLNDQDVVEFLSVPSGMMPNYEVAVLEPSNSIIVGSTTRFVECQGKQCRIGSTVTIAQDVNGVQGGANLVTLTRGTRVVIKDVPSGFMVNFEVVQMQRSQSIILGATTRFQNCGR